LAVFPAVWFVENERINGHNVTSTYRAIVSCNQHPEIVIACYMSMAEALPVFQIPIMSQNITKIKHGT